MIDPFCIFLLSNSFFVVDLEPPEPAALNALKSVDDIIEIVRAHLSEELVQSFGIVYKFVVTGEQSGVFYLDLKNGKLFTTIVLLCDKI